MSGVAPSDYGSMLAVGPRRSNRPARLRCDAETARNLDVATAAALEPAGAIALRQSNRLQRPSQRGNAA